MRDQCDCGRGSVCFIDEEFYPDPEPAHLSLSSVDGMVLTRTANASPFVPFPEDRLCRKLEIEQHLGEGCLGGRPGTL